MKWPTSHPTDWKICWPPAMRSRRSTRRSPVSMPAPRRPVWKPLAAAAVFALLLGGIFGYRALDKNVCTVIVDINPSVTLTVNRLGRVKTMDTGNADAAALLADVDLAGARTQDALGTLTDALADADYLTDADNTLLVTVEGASAARAQKLGRAVYDAAQASAQQRQFSAAVLCQQAADAEQTRTDADAWQVSPGKAALAETIALQTQLDTAQALSALPVQDLLVLAETYDVTFDAAQLYGTVSHDGYRSRGRRAHDRGRRRGGRSGRLHAGADAVRRSARLPCPLCGGRRGILLHDRRAHR